MKRTQLLLISAVSATAIAVGTISMQVKQAKVEPPQLNPVEVRRIESSLDDYHRKNGLTEVKLESVLLEGSDVYAVYGNTLYMLRRDNHKVVKSVHLGEMVRQASDQMERQAVQKLQDF